MLTVAEGLLIHRRSQQELCESRRSSHNGRRQPQLELQ